MPTTRQAGMAAVAVLVAYTVLKVAWPDHRAVEVLDALIFPALGLIYVPLSALAALNARGRLRVAWVALTLGLASWAVGEIIYAYYELAVGETPFPSAADVAYLFYVPCVVLALLLFSSVRTWRDQGRMLLDGVIAAGSFFLISWLGLMRAVWLGDGTSGLTFGISLAYPVGDVLVVTLGFLVLLRAPSGLRTAFTLLVAGLACAAVADSVWAYLSDSTSQTMRALPDVLYLANPLLIIVALVAAHHSKVGTALGAVPQNRLSLWLPIVPLMGAAVLVATSQPGVVIEAPVAVAGVVLIAATLLRQYVESSELVRREQEIRHLADRLTGELDSASHYVASILPGPLDGPVAVSSRYLPARAVGGDCFGYTWIDDDHLVVYLVDVSGHGVKPALLAVSVHNLLRSGGLTREVLLAPDLVLAELNSLFGMDDHDGHYFTMWYGVYQLSTNLLRYANAGHPPPLVLTRVGDTVSGVPLRGASVPLGMFAHGEFATERYVVPPGAQVLLYSDGLLGDPPQLAEFVALCEKLAAGPWFWLDDLIDEVPATDDDCSLVLLTFPGPTAPSGAEAGAGSARSAGPRR